MKRIGINGRRLFISKRRLGKPSVKGGAMSGARDDLFRSEQMKQSLPKGELGQSNMDATIKRNLVHKKRVLASHSEKQISGGTMMDPLAAVRLPKFVNGKKTSRNNIKISL